MKAKPPSLVRLAETSSGKAACGRSRRGVVHPLVSDAITQHSRDPLVSSHRRLPPEMLSAILARLPLRDLITASHVCWYWRSMCLDTARLWCRISWTERRPDALAILLERSRKAKLHLDLHLSLRESETDLAALQVTSAHMDHIASLRIAITVDKGVVARMYNSNSPLHLLNSSQSLTRWLAFPAPILETLSLQIHPQCFYVHLPRDLLHAHAPRLDSVQLLGNFFGPPCFHRPASFAHPEILRQVRFLELAATDGLELLLSFLKDLTRIEDLSLLDGARKRSRVRGYVVSHPNTRIGIRRLTLRLAHRDLTPSLQRFSLASVTSLYLRFYPLVFSALADTGIFTSEDPGLRRLTIDRDSSHRRLTLRFGGADTRLVVVEDVPHQTNSFIREPSFGHVTSISMHEHAFVHIDLPRVTGLHLRLEPPYTAEVQSVFHWTQTKRKPLFVLPALVELSVSAPVMRLDIAQLDILLLIQITIRYTSRRLNLIELKNISCFSGTEHWTQLCRAAHRVKMDPVSIDGRRQFAQSILDGHVQEQTRLDSQ